jgi:hypothetical protein
MSNTYEGWKNRQTWNVALWLNNTYDIYVAAVRFMEINPKLKRPYTQFILSAGLESERTDDNIAWLGSRLDHKSLDDMMRELVA